MEVEHVFKAVADHHRRHILDLLAQADGQTLTQLCALMPMSRFGVMKHLEVLEQAGLITTRKVGREKLHYLTPQPLQNVSSWLDSYRRLWEERMDRLEELLDQIQAEQQMTPPVKEQTDAKE